jgi:hypothetical protein
MATAKDGAYVCATVPRGVIGLIAKDERGGALEVHQLSSEHGRF